MPIVDFLLFGEKKKKFIRRSRLTIPKMAKRIRKLFHFRWSLILWNGLCYSSYVFVLYFFIFNFSLFQLNFSSPIFSLLSFSLPPSGWSEFSCDFTQRDVRNWIRTHAKQNDFLFSDVKEKHLNRTEVWRSGR